MSIEAMKLALEAIEDLRGYRSDIDKAIETLRDALSQQPATPEPVGEPVARVELMTTGGNAGLATRIVEIDDPLRERLRPGNLLYTRPAQSVPDGWVLMPRELTPDEAMKGQGALLDMYWDATTCFAARYAELIRATEPRRAALVAAKGSTSN